ncbi:hypothetical protein QBC43DRAFT_355434 [Cladorrhinum sp. PSN259]|nr:hypothetical protein QBC43DRAFT_355434 [Cladorrhinum sp. PSN259]
MVPPPPYATLRQLEERDASRNRNFQTAGRVLGRLPIYPRFEGHDGPSATSIVPPPTTIQPANPWKFRVESLHIPIDFQSKKKDKDRPWDLKFTIFTDDLAATMQGTIPWRNNLDACYADEISLKWKDNRTSIFERTIKFGWIADGSDLVRWNLWIQMNGRDQNELLRYSRPGIASLITPETVVRITGWSERIISGSNLKSFTRSSDLFYCYNPDRHYVIELPGRSQSRPDIDNPDWRKLVDHNIMRHIECLGNGL